MVKENKMGTESILKLILKMSIPSMISMLIQALYNIIDSIFIAKYSELAFEAISLAFPLQTIMIAVAVGSGIGINSLISRKLGEKNRDEANKVAAHGLIIGVFCWLVFMVLAFTAVPAFFGIYSAPGEAVYSYGVSYTQIVMAASVGIFVEVIIEKMLQATGNMIYPMIFMLIGAITNTILDPIMIFGLLGCPAMGVEGAALATVCGQILSMIFALYVLFTKKHEIKVSFKNFKLDLNIIGNIYKVGLPSILMQSVTSFVTMYLNSVLNVLSTAAVSVLGAYFKLQSFVFMPVFGLTHGYLPIVGYNYGARKKTRLTKTIKTGIGLALIIMTAGTIIFLIFTKALLAPFESQGASPEYMADFLRIGLLALKIIALSFIPAAVSIMISSACQGIGKAFYSLMLTLLRQLIILLPAFTLLSKAGVEYVWYAFPMAEVSSFIVSLVFFFIIKQKYISPMPEE